MVRRLLTFDAFSKTVEDARVRTNSGGIVTIVSTIIIVYLIISEWIHYREIVYRPELIVDKARGERMEINLNITFPHMPCNVLTMDIMDASGEIQNEVSHGIMKTRLDKDGQIISSEIIELNVRESDYNKDPNYCGSCYGAVEGRCCNNCEEVKAAYTERGWAFYDGSGMEQCEKEHYQERIEATKQEGCNIAGHVSVNKVVGNFHFAPGTSFTKQSVHSHDLSMYALPGYPFTFSHIIHDLAFGPSMGYNQDDVLNPLDGTIKETNIKGFNYQYFIKVVSTRYEKLNGTSIETNQYSVTSHERRLEGGRDEDHPHTLHSRGGVPGVFFNYDISPMKVINRELRPKSFGTFLTGICAIIGGVLTFGAVVDRGVWEADKVMRRKKMM